MILIVAVSPAFKEDLSDIIETIEGADVSTVIVLVFETAAFPAASDTVATSG